MSPPSVNRLDPVFFEAGDYRLCRRLSSTAARPHRREKSSKLSVRQAKLT